MLVSMIIMWAIAVCAICVMALAIRVAYEPWRNH